MRQPLDLWGQRGWCGQEVAGESHYADAIRKVFGPKLTTEWSEAEAVAQILPDPNNRYDRSAVQVLIDGSVVGYLPKEDAARYAPVLSGLVAQGWLPQVAARVLGALVSDYGYDARGREHETTRFAGSVMLDLAEPHMLVPANLPPESLHVMLPRGASIQVTGEEAHLSTLAPLVGAAGEAWLHVTLHEVTEQLPRSSRTLVEVRVNGSAVGRLTPKMSGELLPVVRHFAGLGLLTGGRAILKGNQLKADITIYMARSGELPQEWLANPPVSGASGQAASASSVVPGELATGVSSASAALEATLRVGTTTSWRFNPPPGWPEPPPGWVPQAEWTVPPGLPPAPEGWQWWLPG